LCEFLIEIKLEVDDYWDNIKPLIDQAHTYSLIPESTIRKQKDFIIREYESKVKSSDYTKRKKIIENLRMVESSHPLVKRFEKEEELFEKIRNEYAEAIRKHSNLTLPSWLTGMARHLASGTLDFVRDNKHILFNKRKSLTSQEYLKVLKFEIVVKNLSTLAFYINSIKTNYSQALSGFILKILSAVGLLVLLIWGAYQDTDFCLLINISLIIAIVFLIQTRGDNKNSKGG